MLREIGSNFWLNYSDIERKQSSSVLGVLSELGIKGNDCALLSTGRSAISFVLKQIKEQSKKPHLVALVPPYTCETVIMPFRNYGFKVASYPIDDMLSTTSEMLEKAIEDNQPEVVLLHRYFGFDTLKGIAQTIEYYRKQGVIFIEDRTQSLFSEIPLLPVDYVVGSFRKWDAIPDGGFAISICGKFGEKPIGEDRKLVEAKLKAFYAKNNYMVCEGCEKTEFLQMFADAEKILVSEKEFYRMSTESQYILGSLDMNNVKKRRRENYRSLYDELKYKTDLQILTGPLGDENVPLYMTLRTVDRGLLQNKLKEHNIYAPIIWPRSEMLPAICKEAEEVYNSVLSIPVDQRYREDDMERISEIIKNN
jgi:hypothetical protein